MWKKYVETTWFFPIEITSKKYVEATCKYVDIFFLTYRRNIDMESMLITRVVLVGFAEIFLRLMCFLGTNEKVQHRKLQHERVSPGKSAIWNESNMQ